MTALIIKSVVYVMSPLGSSTALSSPRTTASRMEWIGEETTERCWSCEETNMAHTRGKEAYNMKSCTSSDHYLSNAEQAITVFPTPPGVLKAMAVILWHLKVTFVVSQ